MEDKVKGWTETTVGDFAPFLYGKGLSERQRNQAGTVPVFGSNGIVGTHNEALVNNSGIVIGRKGTDGAVHFCKCPFWPIDTTFYVENKPDREIRYIYYLLRSLGLEHMNADSAVPGLNRNAAHARKILVPPISEQKAIASILGALDDKIELNRKMNETLEAMARAIFKSWFVDFEPIPLPTPSGARQSGGLGPHKEWQDSPLGKIPKGWRVSQLGNYVEFVKGKKPKYVSQQHFENSLPQILIENLDGAPFLYADINNTIQVSQEQTIMVMDGASSGRVEIGYEGIIGSTLAKIQTKKVSDIFVYHYLKLNEQLIKENTTGTSIPHTDKGLIRKLEFVLPPEYLLTKFSDIATGVLKQKITNRKQSVTLASIRDALLPKLLSGEIRVKDAERFVEAAS